MSTTAASISTAVPIGDLLKTWRQRRRMSQLDLSLEAEISTRHLSFLETGRSHPSREMVLHLAEHLDVPLRERNVLLVAAGYAPSFPERSLDDPALAAARRAVDVVLRGHEPFPALAVDRYWTMVAANRMVPVFLEGVNPAMLRPPVNVIRLSLHPEGLAPRIENFTEWRGHLLERLRQQIDLTADPALIALLEEVRGYPSPKVAAGTSSRYGHGHDLGGIAIPFRLRTSHGVLSAISTTTIFGTPLDVTLSELAIETFFPADAATAETLRRIAEGMSAPEQESGR
jgi:transcriptional regulator with XRE-family HTH domain